VKKEKATTYAGVSSAAPPAIASSGGLVNPFLPGGGMGELTADWRFSFAVFAAALSRNTFVERINLT